MAIKGLSNGLTIGYPYDTWDLGARMKMFSDRGGKISVSITCLIARGLRVWRCFTVFESVIVLGICRIFMFVSLIHGFMDPHVPSNRQGVALVLL